MKKAKIGRPPVKNPRVKKSVSLTKEALKIVTKAKKYLDAGSRSDAIDQIIKQWDKTERNCNGDW